MTDILVAGASGFVGRHLVPVLQRQHNVVAVDRGVGDLADSSTWAGLPGTDVVINLAARSFVPASWADPRGFIASNLHMTLGALDYCRKHNARLIHASSYLYGSPQQLPVDEAHPVAAVNPYALSKKMSEEACNFYASNFSVSTTILRPFNIFGPGQSTEFLIPSIVSQALWADEIVVRDMEPKRDYLFIEDFIDSIVSVILHKEAQGVYNIGSGKSISVDQLINTVFAITDHVIPVRCLNERRPNEIMDVRADISKARRDLDWEPGWSLRDGLAAVITSMREQGRSVG